MKNYTAINSETGSIIQFESATIEVTENGNILALNERGKIIAIFSPDYSVLKSEILKKHI